MRNPYLRIILFILAYWVFITPSYANDVDIQRALKKQGEVLRNQQQIFDTEKRKNISSLFQNDLEMVMVKKNFLVAI